MATTIFTTPQSNDRLAQLWDDLLADPVPPHPAAVRQSPMRARFERNDVLQMTQASLTTAAKPESARRSWKADLTKLFHSLLELEGTELAPLPEAVLDGSVQADHEASLSSASPFRWEPKPAWINAPVWSGSPILSPADPRRFAARPKIPVRPLHKQPLFKRFLFCLRRWMNRKSRTTV